MTKTVKQLANAIDTIAEYLNEPVEYTDRDSGEVIERNELAFVQERMLNTLCYQATRTLEISVASQDKAAGKVRGALRSHAGDEISDEKLQGAMRWKERMDLQVSTVQELLETARERYTAHTGREFGAGRNITVAIKSDNLSEAQKAAIAMLGEHAEGNNGGGVETAENPLP